jgi:hypothetical protein
MNHANINATIRPDLDGYRKSRKNLIIAAGIAFGILAGIWISGIAGKAMTETAAIQLEQVQ